MRLSIAVPVLSSVLLLAACRGEAPAPPAADASVPDATPAQPVDASPTPAPSDTPATPAPGDAMPPPDMGSATPPTDAWIGKWVGPEGTLLELSREGEGYAVKIQSLDGPASYTGEPVGDHIEFTRNGKRESIVAGDGAATGMKWLADKKDCLVIQAGEGFCRD